MTTRKVNRYIVTRTNTYYYNTSWRTGTYEKYSVGQSATKCSEDSSIGSDDPFWKDKVVKKQDATNPYTRKGYKTNRPVHLAGSSTTKSGPNVITSMGEGVYAHNTAQVQEYVAVSDAALRDLALLRLKRKIGSHLNKQNLAVPIVELREMRGMIRGMAEYSTTFLHKLAGIKKTKGKSAKKAFDEAWLTYSFGLSPMVGDFKDALDNVQAALDRADHNVVLSGAAKKDWFQSHPQMVSTFLFGTPAIVDATVYHVLSYRYEGGFAFKLLSSNDYSTSKLFSFSIEALPTVGWELLPYSWMIDYFTNVGAFLDDTFVLPPGSSTYIILNTRHRVTCGITASTRPSPGTLVSTTTKPGRAEWERFERSKIASLPRIGLHVKSMDQIGTNAVNKLLNLAALLKYR